MEKDENISVDHIHEGVMSKTIEEALKNPDFKSQADHAEGYFAGQDATLAQVIALLREKGLKTPAERERIERAKQ